MLTDSYSQLGNQESYSVQTGSYPSNCPPQISTGDSCSYIVVQLKHNGNLTINDLTSSFSGNLTLFNEDYSGIQSSYYFTPVQGLPYHYTYHDNNSADFGIIENSTISNLNLGFYSAGTYYLLILGNFPNGFINDISFALRYTVISLNLFRTLTLDFIERLILFVSSILPVLGKVIENYNRKKDRVNRIIRPEPGYIYSWLVRAISIRRSTSLLALCFRVW